MPVEDGKTQADDATTPDSSLHAYKEGRKEDVSGDADKLESNKPQDQQQEALEGEDELSLHHEKQ